MHVMHAMHLQAVLEDCVARSGREEIRPLPTQGFELQGEGVEGFKFLQRAEHIGKVHPSCRAMPFCCLFDSHLS